MGTDLCFQFAYASEIKPEKIQAIYKKYDHLFVNNPSPIKRQLFLSTEKTFRQEGVTILKTLKRGRTETSFGNKVIKLNKLESNNSLTVLSNFQLCEESNGSPKVLEKSDTSDFDVTNKIITENRQSIDENGDKEKSLRTEEINDNLLLCKEESKVVSSDEELDGSLCFFFERLIKEKESEKLQEKYGKIMKSKIKKRAKNKLMKGFREEYERQLDVSLDKSNPFKENMMQEKPRKEVRFAKVEKATRGWGTKSKEKKNKVNKKGMNSIGKVKVSKFGEKERESSSEWGSLN